MAESTPAAGKAKTGKRKQAAGKSAGEKQAGGKAKRRIGAKLTPAKPKVPGNGADGTAETVTPDQHGPTPERPTVDPKALEAWRAMPEAQRSALREREARRLFADAAERHRAGELDAAVDLYGKALALSRANPDIYNNLGVALRQLGKLETSVACYRRALSLRPNNAGVYSNMGNALREMGRLEVAKASHRQAVKLAPKSPEAYYNLGLVLRDLGEIEAAFSCFDRALELNPEHIDCHWDRALTKLLAGDYPGGFDEYEWRWKLDRSPARGFSQPAWDGSAMKGKTILIHQEQGFGDMIQFVRYLPEVKKRSGANVVVEVQPELARLFSTVAGVDKVVNKGADLPKFDAWLPMLSLARVLGITGDAVGGETPPYLSPPELHPVQLPANLGSARKIGISWAGKPTHQNDHNRSCGFEHFVELLGLPGCGFYSLQKGPAAVEIREMGAAPLVVDLGSRLGDFAETAAVIRQLDLVITVDTAVAHLAGALGTPVWVALPFVPDWRWGLGAADTPWYPSMRLFRQRRPAAWHQVFTDIRKALSELTAPGD